MENCLFLKVGDVDTILRHSGLIKSKKKLFSYLRVKKHRLDYDTIIFFDEKRALIALDKNSHFSHEKKKLWSLNNQTVRKLIKSDIIKELIDL